MSAHAIPTSFVPTLRLADDAAPVRTSIGSRRNPLSHAAILDAAERLLLTRGPAGVTMDAVARDARAGKPTVYRWWPDRLSLFLELHARATQSMSPTLGNAFADDLRSLATAILDAWQTTAAGPALRAIVAEAQASDAARERADVALSSYRDAIACVADAHGVSIDADATFEAWLAAFLFRPATAGAAVGRQIESITNAPIASIGVAAASPSLVDRRDWVV